jgi:hypothetical protein
MVEATGLKLWRRGYLRGNDLSAKFRRNLPVGSKVISGGHRQTGDFISIIFISKGK